MKTEHSKTKIAAEIGVNKSTISRELRRNRGKRGYFIKQIRKLMEHKSARTNQYHYLPTIEPDIEEIRGPLD